MNGHQKHLLLVARDSVLDSLGGIADGLLGGGENALALVGCVVLAGAGAVTELLGGGLVLVWLDGTGSAVVETSSTLLGLIESGLLGVRSDLLLHLVTESLAAEIRHDDCLLGGKVVCLESLCGCFEVVEGC